MTWLAEIPSCVVQACLVMLPRLTAEESQLAATRAAVGSGNAGESAAAILQGWASDADGSPRLATVAPEERPARDPGELIGLVKIVRAPRKVSA